MPEVSEPVISDVTLANLDTFAPLLSEALRSKIRGKNDLRAFFREQHHSVSVNGTKATLRCHILVDDGNGRPRVAGLAEKLRKQILDYSIPRSQIAEAAAKYQSDGSTEALEALHGKAKSLFTDLANTGEGGEILLYYLAERFLGIPQIFCKMPLKTNTRMHYHGVDGIHASVCKIKGHLALYWGESKLYETMARGISECFESVAPFLVGVEGTGAAAARDLQLLRDNLDLDDAQLESALEKFLDPDHELFQKTEFRGICLVGYDHSDYEKIIGTDKSAISPDAMKVFEDCAKKIESAISKNKIEAFVIETFCVPFPSVEEFRKCFLKELGLSNGT